MSATVHTVRPRAILLDLDDTIIDFGSSAEPAGRAVCAEAAAQAPGMLTITDLKNLDDDTAVEAEIDQQLQVAIFFSQYAK